jgi:hypothetical protein
MRIKKLTDSSVLKPGELLVVLHCLTDCGYNALVDSRKSIGTGVVQFYRHRQGASSMDSPVEEWKIVPALENNERAKGSLQQQGDKRNPRISRRRLQTPAKTKFAYVAGHLRRSLSSVSTKLERAP